MAFLCWRDALPVLDGGLLAPSGSDCTMLPTRQQASPREAVRGACGAPLDGTAGRSRRRGRAQRLMKHFLGRAVRPAGTLPPSPPGLRENHTAQDLVSGPGLTFIERFLGLPRYEMVIAAAGGHVAAREAGPRRCRGLAIRNRLLFPLVPLMPFAQVAQHLFVPPLPCLGTPVSTCLRGVARWHSRGQRAWLLFRGLTRDLANLSWGPGDSGQALTECPPGARLS